MQDWPAPTEQPTDGAVLIGCWARNWQTRRPIQTVADEIEATEARTTTAINRMKQAMAPITAGASGALVPARKASASRQAMQFGIDSSRQLRASPPGQVGNMRRWRFPQATRAFDAYDAAMQRNAASARTFEGCAAAF